MNAKIVALLIVVGFVGMFNVATAADPLCSLEPAVGLCKASIPRFASVGGKCQEFIYGGCGGNANNFQTQAECEAKCG
uniref:Kunitz-type serine protease inhibitor cvp2 n=1 Tax=Pimpla hypochondriaca TaxID=135724 RepID=VKT2_PIMHY|nr:RecName: Full=Kunitz-type serine protease inhibitor cvp2; AltName: Full=Cysteine-rich venom protein 2; Short=cvp2; Flags: Precursor [Pimpla hypochondriaca]CAD27738.1 cysteine-rich venom protein 2 [Pimpla hypochondriaca]